MHIYYYYYYYYYCYHHHHRLLISTHSIQVTFFRYSLRVSHSQHILITNVQTILQVIIYRYVYNLPAYQISYYISHLTFFISKVKVKVKCTLVQALRLCTGRTAHRESGCIALLFHDHSTRRG